jgi:hypothetical protein
MVREYIVSVTDEVNPDAFQRFENYWSPEQEIVRCEDCKHRSEKLYDYYGDPNNKVYVCQINDLAKKPDWFCADGERDT